MSLVILNLVWSNSSMLAYFEGGSTLLLLFQPGVLAWDDDLVSNASQSLETLVPHLGSSIANFSYESVRALVIILRLLRLSVRTRRCRMSRRRICEMRHVGSKGVLPSRGGKIYTYITYYLVTNPSIKVPAPSSRTKHRNERAKAVNSAVWIRDERSSG